MYGIALCIIILFLLLLVAMLIAKCREDRKKAEAHRQEMNGSPILAIIGDHQSIQPYLKENLDKRFILIENTEGEQGWQNACKALKEHPETCHIPIILLSAPDEETTVLKGEVLYAETEQESASPTKQLTETESELIIKIRQIVEENLQNPDFSVKKLSEQLNMSQPTLYRRVKEATNTTIIEQIRTIRMKRAGELLAEQKYTVQEVAELVGYNDMPTFRKHFTDFYHTTPSAFKKENKK